MKFLYSRKNEVKLKFNGMGMFGMRNKNLRSIAYEFKIIFYANASILVHW